MSEHDDLRARVAALEAQIAEISKNVADAFKIIEISDRGNLTVFKAAADAQQDINERIKLIENRLFPKANHDILKIFKIVGEDEGDPNGLDKR